MAKFPQQQADLHGGQTCERKDDDFVSYFLVDQIGEVDIFVSVGNEDVFLLEILDCLILFADGDLDWIPQGGSLQFLDFVGHCG